LRKRILLAVMAASLLFALPGCAAEARPLTITVTFYPLYVAAINVARGVEGVQVRCMAQPRAGCLHDYQMTTADRRALAGSAVVIRNGAGLEGFLDKLLPSLGAVVIDASEGVALLPERDAEGDNPHVWVSVSGMIAQVKNIAAGLSAADPEHAAQYAQNCADYVGRLEALGQEMRLALAPYAGFAIVTFHEAFDYFAAEFGLRVVAVVQADHASAPSAWELKEVAQAIRQENVRALFAEPQYEGASVEVLARETGVPVYTLDAAVSGPLSPPPYGAYLEIMRKNMDTLVEALS